MITRWLVLSYRHLDKWQQFCKGDDAVKDISKLDLFTGQPTGSPKKLPPIDSPGLSLGICSHIQILMQN